MHCSKGGDTGEIIPFREFPVEDAKGETKNEVDERGG